MGLSKTLRRALDSDFRPIYLAGVAGSGTTLSSSLLDQHFKVAAALHESAREAETTSPLYMHNIEWHDSVPQYYRHLFFNAHVTAGDVRRCSLRLYRESARYPKLSNVVIDKAPNSHLVRMSTLHAAFPDSRVLLVFRDPVANIEGLRRKWPKLFGVASIRDVCDFWEKLHRQFEADVAGFERFVRWYEYEALVANPDAWLEETAGFCELERRKEPRRYKDRSNEPGKGLRNVSEGVIEVDRDAAAGKPGTLSPVEVEEIRSRLSGPHARLRARAGVAGPSVAPAS